MELDSGSELRRTVFQFFRDHGNFLTFEEWKAYEEGHPIHLDTVLQTQWIAHGYIRHNEEKKGYELTGMGQDHLNRLNVWKNGVTPGQGE